MVIKSIFMFTIYLAPYFLLLSNQITNGYAQLGLVILMGVGMSGIGLSVMHDANHGSYSKNQFINKIMSLSITLIGGSSINWQLQHNNLHHTFTNIEGHDEDIAPLGFLRFSPHAEFRKIHRFQFLYAWFFYGLMTIMWAFTKDFAQLKRYHKMDLLKVKQATYSNELAKLIFAKVLYLGCALLLPMLVMNVMWWEVLLGFFVMHFTCGLILALIFQPAHVVEMTDFPLPNETTNTMEDEWAIHQLKTTANFAPKSYLFSWFVGGLNFQIEHHLFPKISHVHYPAISKIVKAVCLEYQLEYIEYPTMRKAIGAHVRWLRQMGR